MLKINILKNAAKFLKKHTPKHGKQVTQKIIALMENPKPNDSKWLRRRYPYMRVGAGELRHYP